jgi:DNA-binding MarR family transcriptional regulator
MVEASRPDIDPLAFDADPALLIEVCAQLLASRTLDRLIAEGCTGLRASDGFVFQHLVPGPLRITELARKLHVTQQGASKSVADLERRGFVQRAVAPDDDRARLVSLTELGWRAVNGARAVRRELSAELEQLLGADHALQFGDALRRLTDRLGGFDALRHRRLVQR